MRRLLAGKRPKTALARRPLPTVAVILVPLTVGALTVTLRGYHL